MVSNQLSQGIGFGVPCESDVKAAAFVDPRPASFNDVNRSLDVFKSFVSAKDWRQLAVANGYVSDS